MSRATARSPRALGAARAVGIAGIACALALGCVDQPAGPSIPGPGVAFTYPMPGQHDVPTAARLVLVFTHPVDDAAFAQPCTIDASGAVSGGVCVVGPDGLVPTVATLPAVGDPDAAGTAVHVRPEAGTSPGPGVSPALAPGASYDVWVSPDLLGVRTANIPADAPLLSFHTRQARARAGEPAEIATVGGHDPAGYASADATPALPFADFGTARVLMTEPLDPHSAILGQTVRFTRPDPDNPGGELDVPGQLLVQGTYLVFDPDDDLEPDVPHRLQLLAGLEDLGGEPVPEATLAFTPRNSRIDGALLENVLDTQPAAGDEGFPADAPVLGGAVNTMQLSSQLVGNNQLAVTDGSVRSQLGDPASFDGAIPVVIRKGQLLGSAGLAVAFGGEVPSGLDTGDIEVRFLSDATGYLIRNPYRDPDEFPDDDRAPVWITLALDVAITAADPTGNAVLNQTLLGVELAGVAVADGNQLAIETTGTLELDLLGVSRAPVDLVLRLRTDPAGAVADDGSPPVVTATYPAPGDEAFAPGDSLLVTFSEAIEIADRDAVSLEITAGPGAGTQVPVSLARYGSTLVVTPAQPLAYGASFSLAVDGAVRDLAGHLFALPGGDPGGVLGQGALVFATPVLSAAAPSAPVLTALYPGAPCALTDGGQDALGRCVGGDPQDPLIPPAVLPADRAIVAEFAQPMDPATMTVGAQCGVGSVRVERIDDQGACEAAVSGTLSRSERGFRFVPNAPWTPGERYRLTLVGGPDAACDPGELCSRGAPLNTDPLCGTTDAGTDANRCANATGLEAGGPDIEIPFTGAAASADVFVATSAEPHTDVNGNGAVDPDEIPRDDARAVVTITGVGGFVREAWFSTTGCLGPRDDLDEAIDLTASLPVVIGAAQVDCALGDPNDPIQVESCIPVQLTPQILFGTSIGMCADAEIEGQGILANLRTRQLLMRLAELPGEPLVGAIAELPGEDGPRLVARMTVLMDAPDMRIVGMTHDLRSKPVTLEVAGPVAFMPDGRIEIQIANTRDAVLRVEVAETANPLNTGFIEMTIGAGAMTARLVSEPVKDQHLRGTVE